MPNYRVVITETVEYVVTVDADNHGEAEAVAEDVIVNAENMNDYFQAVVDRSADATEVKYD